MKIIAIEEHFMTRAIRDAWAAIPGADDGTAALNDPTIDARLDGLGDMRLALMDETGVDVQVLSVTTAGLNNLGEHGVDLARRTNDEIAGVVAANPARFQALATLPAAGPETAARELERCVRDLGFRGAILHGRVGDRNLDHPMFDPTFACAESLGVPLLIHPQIPRRVVRDAYYGGFGDATDLALSTFGIGWHYEAGVQFLRLVLAGVFDRYPRLQVILGHWGEVVLFYLERLAMLDRVATLERPLVECVRQNLYLTGSGMFSADYCARAVAMVGQERILFSTDYPYQYRPGGDARRFVDGLTMAEADRMGFAHGNWERLTGAPT